MLRYANEPEDVNSLVDDAIKSLHDCFILLVISSYNFPLFSDAEQTSPKCVFDDFS